MPIVSRKFAIYWLPVAVLCAIIFIQSCFPSIDSKPLFPFEDKIKHMVAYGLLAALFFRAGMATWPRRMSLSQLFWISVLFSTLYGVSDELHQAFVPMRHADVYDLLADLVGSILGAAAYRIWYHRFS